INNQLTELITLIVTDIHQSPIESIYQTFENELKRQQASVNSLFLLDTNNNDDDHGFRNEDQVNAVMDSTHDADMNTEDNNHNNILTDVTMLSDYQLHCTICHKNPFKQKLLSSDAVLNQLMKRLKNSLLKQNHNVLIYKQYENCLNNLMRRAQGISMWAIQFKQDVIQCSMEEIHLNQEVASCVSGGIGVRDEICNRTLKARLAKTYSSHLWRRHDVNLAVRGRVYSDFGAHCFTRRL
ncbi:unnamed protein product, partial [Trichobilharzia regenti]